MKITLKEAWNHACEALPDYNVEVEASLGSYNVSSSRRDSIQWKIWARKKGGNESLMSGQDEIFSLALTKVVSEVEREKIKPVEDVVVDNDKEEKPTSETEEIKNIDLPF